MATSEIELNLEEAPPPDITGDDMASEADLGADEGSTLDQVLHLQDKILQLVHHRDIRVAVQQKLRHQLKAMVKILLEQEKVISQQSGEIKVLREGHSSLHKAIDSIGKAQTQEKALRKPTYADAAAAGKDKVQKALSKKAAKARSKSRTRKPEYVAAIYPKEDQTSEVTLTKLKKRMNPSKVGISIKSVRPIQKGGILVKVDTAADVEKLIKEVNDTKNVSKDFTVEKPKGRDPRVILYDISEEFTDNSLIKKLTQSNPDYKLEQSDLNIITSYKGKRGQNWVISMKVEAYKRVTKGKKLRLGWGQVSFREYLKPTLCFKCLRFGHVAKHCRGTERCGNCGEVDHKAADCQNSKKCVNCALHNEKFNLELDTSHQARDKKCDTYKRELTQLFNRTYGP